MVFTSGSPVQDITIKNLTVERPADTTPVEGMIAVSASFGNRVRVENLKVVNPRGVCHFMLFCSDSGIDGLTVLGVGDNIQNTTEHIHAFAQAMWGGENCYMRNVFIEGTDIGIANYEVQPHDITIQNVASKITSYTESFGQHLQLQVAGVNVTLDNISLDAPDASSSFIASTASESLTIGDVVFPRGYTPTSLLTGNYNWTGTITLGSRNFGPAKSFSESFSVPTGVTTYNAPPGIWLNAQVEISTRTGVTFINTPDDVFALNPDVTTLPFLSTRWGTFDGATYEAYRTGHLTNDGRVTFSIASGPINVTFSGTYMPPVDRKSMGFSSSGPRIVPDPALRFSTTVTPRNVTESLDGTVVHHEADISCTAIDTGALARGVTYESLDPTIATVNQSGNVKYVSDGTARIRVSTPYFAEIATVSVSREIEVVPVGAPQSPAAVYAVAGNASVDVFWHSSQWGSPDTYEVHRGTSSGFTPSGGTLLHSETGAARQYTDSTASNGTTYYYKVLASNVNGASLPVLATAFPDIVNEIVPASTLSGPVIPAIVQWWEFDETSDGTAPVTRGCKLPTAFPRNWEILWQDTKSFGTDYLHSAVVDGRTVLHGEDSYGSGTLTTGDTRMFGGYGGWTVLMRLQTTGMNNDQLYLQQAGEAGSAAGRNPIQILGGVSGQKITMHSFPLWGDTADTLQSSVDLNPNEWYTIACGYDVGADRLFIITVDHLGNITRDVGSTGIGPRQMGQRFNRTCTVCSKFHGYMAPLVFIRNAPSDAVLTWFNNGGTGRTFDEARFSPLPDPGPAPFSYAHKQKQGFFTQAETISAFSSDFLVGIYWLRPYPLYQWNSEFSAANGRYVWVYSSDHGHTAGPIIGFSDDPGVRPTSWYYALNTLYGGGDPTIQKYILLDGRHYDGGESPWMHYVPDDANGRPFYLYCHCEQLETDPPNGCRTNPNGFQQTNLFTSADLVTWVLEGAAVPNTACPDGNTDYNHTGYLRIWPPGTLPGINTYTGYHLSIDTYAEQLVTTTDDPKVFQPLITIPESAPNDPWTAFSDGAFRDATEFGNFAIVGGRIFDTLAMSAPNFRGMAVMELILDHGAFRQPVLDKRWQLGEPNTDDTPTLGYTQSVKTYYEDGILHVYRLKGFGKEQHDARTDYYTAVFNEATANTARPIGATAVQVSADVVVSVFDALPHQNYRVYRKSGGSYSLLGTLDTTPDGSNRLNFTDTAPTPGTYTYQVRTLYSGAETNGAELPITVS